MLGDGTLERIVSLYAMYTGKGKIGGQIVVTFVP